MLQSMPEGTDRYKFISVLGRGGMGTVYKVYDNKLDRIVALKLISSGNSATKKEKERFIREAQAIARLKHPNIVSLYEISENQDQLFFTMDFVEGCSLAKFLDKSENRLTTKQVISLMLKICDAVNYAHSQGVIHRDLKPSNIMMDGIEPKLMDFGLAKIKNVSKNLSKTGEILGTLKYMSPEQVEESKSVDERSDIYSLGSILYKIITGKVPFDGSPINILHKILNTKPEPPSNLKKRVHKGIEYICLKTLEKNKNDRHQDVNMLIKDLKNYRRVRQNKNYFIPALMTISILSFSLIFFSYGRKTPSFTFVAFDIVDKEKISKKKFSWDDEIYMRVKLNIKFSETNDLTLYIQGDIKDSITLTKSPKKGDQEFLVKLKTLTSKKYSYRVKVSVSFLKTIHRSQEISFERENPDSQKIKGFSFLKVAKYSCGGQTHTVKEYVHKKTGMECVLIPSGEFLMGNDHGEIDEIPIHKVRIDSFLMSKTEVTQSVWKKIMNTEPWRKGKTSYGKGDNYAANNISWLNAMEFCKKTDVRLPTEAEWEYSCRAGTQSIYYWGNEINSEYLWYKVNTYYKKQKYAHKVAMKKPNAFGLYDTVGNVWELCSDWYDKDYYKKSKYNNPKGADFGTQKVSRGGSWYYSGHEQRSAIRGHLKIWEVGGTTGFRFCRSITE